MSDELPTLPSRYGSVPARVRLVDELFREVADAAVALSMSRVLVVTDAGVRDTVACGAVVTALGRRVRHTATWSEVVPDPDDDAVARAAIAARANDVDGIVAIGGGSVLDTAKGAALLLGHDGPVTRWRGYQALTRPVPPILAVPTTAGTGSEAESFAVLTRAGDRAKVAVGAAALMPRIALLDPRITVSCPPETTAIAGLDALGHAVEAAVTTVGTPASRAHAAKAFALLWQNLPVVLASPADLAARAAMLRGACMAGQAIEASMLGAAHAAANPLSTRFGLPHGIAVATMLPSVIRHNADVPGVAATYAALAASVGLDRPSASTLATAIEDLVRRALPRRERPAWLLGRSIVDALGVEAAGQWTGTFNPRPLDGPGFAALYRAAGLR